MNKHKLTTYAAGGAAVFTAVMLLATQALYAQTYSNTPTNSPGTNTGVTTGTTNTLDTSGTTGSTTSSGSNSMTNTVPANVNSIIPTVPDVNSGTNSSNTNTSASASTSMNAGTNTSGSTSANTGTTMNAQTSVSNPATTAASAPAPQVLDIDTNGGVLLRGAAVSSGSGSNLSVSSWGGTWTIRTSASTTMYPSSGTASSIPSGHFVGVVGTVATDQPMTIDATVVRDWTTDPITQTSATTNTSANTNTSTSATSPAGSAGANTGTNSTNGSTGTADTSGAGTAGAGSTQSGSSSAAGSASSTSSSGIPNGDTLYTGQATDVSNISSGTFTLMGSNGTQYTVNVGPGATIWNKNGSTISLQSISQNDTVRVDAQLQSDGSLTADVVRDTSM